MRQANKKDKDLVVHIISNTLNENPGITWMLKLKENNRRYLRRLAIYVFYKSLFKKGVYISSNERGVALCYNFNTRSKSLIPLYYQIVFALTSVKISTIPKIFKVESYKLKQRPNSGEYLYFWFFAVLKGGEDAGFELKNVIFEKARTEKLPIFAETSVERNKIIYERYGFETYHYCEYKKENLKYWFMKWDPENSVLSSHHDDKTDYLNVLPKSKAP